MTSKPTLSTPITPSNTPPLTHHFLSAYSPKNRSQLSFTGPGRTKQSFKDECDINTIMRRYQLTGEIAHLSQRSPIFGDFPEMDFNQAMAIVVQARENFSQLPAEVRDRFANDPARLLAFLQDPDNREEGIKLGLLRKPEPPAKPPVAPPTVSPTVTPPPTPKNAS
ncbi:MAG: internal scaffolding protein [Microviridae sp.]|nr:MAG: internal scaffolding protein [Microviridae sp.]